MLPRIFSHADNVAAVSLGASISSGIGVFVSSLNYVDLWNGPLTSSVDQTPRKSPSLAQPVEGAMHDEMSSPDTSSSMASHWDCHPPSVGIFEWHVTLAMIAR